MSTRREHLTLGVYVCDHAYCDIEECDCLCHRIATMYPNETSAIKVDMSIPEGTMILVPPRDRDEPLAVWASRAIVVCNIGYPIALELLEQGSRLRTAAGKDKDS